MPVAGEVGRERLEEQPVQLLVRVRDRSRVRVRVRVGVGVRVGVKVRVKVRVRVRDRVRVRRRCSSERPTKRKSTAMSSRLRSSANETRVERFSASSSRPG